MVRNLDELNRVPGMDQQVLAAVKKEFATGSFNILSSASSDRGPVSSSGAEPCSLLPAHWAAC